MGKGPVTASGGGSVLVHLVADYGPGDLAAAEVTQRLALQLPGAAVVYVPVPPFDTVSAGFCVAQLALTDGPRDRLVYCNVAPRADADAPREGNVGERLVAARLADGGLVVAVDAGHALSFIRNEAESLQEVAIPETGSQFRSRDAFPPLIARLAAGDTAVLADAVPPGSVPDRPERAVLYTDGYGNLKTGWTEPPAEVGSRVTVRVGAATAAATVSDGTFAVPAGELAFAPGSSGWRSRSGPELAFHELLLRGGNAAKVLDFPAAGTPIEVTPSP
jgi:hypothetical protein